MKKIISVFTAALIASSALFTGCSKSTSDGANYTFDYAMPGNPESLDPQYASDENSRTVIGNLFLGLMTMDDKGVLQNGVADSYTASDDGLTYTFELKKELLLVL